MSQTADLRARAKAFYNALDLNVPISFGQDDLFKDGRGEEFYVEAIHGDADHDPVQELATQIDFAESAGAYLFTGNRGTGKTSELFRLAKALKELDCEVFYVDIADYVSLTRPIEITDLLISMLGGFSEKIADRFHRNPGRSSFFQQIWDLLSAEVKFQEIKLPAGPIEFKAALVQNLNFKDELQRRMRGLVQDLVRKARDFVLEAVTLVRIERADPDKKIVLIVDSLEKLRGIGGSTETRAVFDSAASLFTGHADELRFTGLNVVYTVPPYLSALSGALGASYAGGRIYTLPSVHIYEACPDDGERPTRSPIGVGKMRLVVERRYPSWHDFLTQDQIDRLAETSGGDLRDYFRMLRLVVTNTPTLRSLPVPDALLDDAEASVRGDMLPLADDDRAWLARILHSHRPELESLDRLPDFARLQEGKYLLHYRNREDWYDVHPLLRKVVDPDAGHPAGA